MALRNAEFDGREIRLSLASHPGKAIKAEGDCCCICCCASDLTLGPESEAVVVTYEMTTGKLKRNPCGQNVGVDWGKHAINTNLSSNKCFVCPEGDESSFDILSDGTLADRKSPDLVIGFSANGGKPKLVQKGDPNRCIFEVLQQTPEQQAMVETVGSREDVASVPNQMVMGQSGSATPITPAGGKEKSRFEEYTGPTMAPLWALDGIGRKGAVISPDASTVLVRGVATKAVDLPILGGSNNDDPSSIITALDMKTGLQLWTKKECPVGAQQEEMWRIPISPDASTVLVRDSGSKSTIEALDMKTGQQRWTTPKVSVHFMPVISQDGSTVLLRDYDKNSMMKAIDMKTGEQLWTVEKVSCSSWGEGMVGEMEFKYKPLISPDSSIVLVRDYDKNSVIKALDIKTGQQLWAVDKVSAKGYNPVISPNGSTVLFRDYDKTSMMKAFDMKTGKQQWTVDKVCNSGLWQAPRISPTGSMVLVRDYDKSSRIKAFDMNTGQQQWNVENVSTSVVPSMSSDGSTVLVQPKDGKNNIAIEDCDVSSYATIKGTSSI